MKVAKRALCTLLMTFAFGCASASSGSHANRIEKADALASASATRSPSTTSSLKLLFIIDKEYDRKHLVSMFRHSDPAGLESRAKSMGIPLEAAQAIRDAKNDAEAEKVAAPFIDEAFQTNGSAIASAKQEFETLWDTFLRIFSQNVSQTTEAPWVHDQYICVVSALHPGLSSWYGNTVAVKYSSTPTHKLRILAHEILLSNLFQLFRKINTPSEISDWQVWAFSEITAVFILDHPTLRSYWPAFPSAGDYFKHSNYPQLAELEKTLKTLFDARASFAEYMQASAPVIRTVQRTHRDQRTER